jgi:hypothetical protein
MLDSSKFKPLQLQQWSLGAAPFLRAGEEEVQWYI